MRLGAGPQGGSAMVQCRHRCCVHARPACTLRPPEAPDAAWLKNTVGLRQFILDRCGDTGARLRPGEVLRLIVAAAAAGGGGSARGAAPRLLSAGRLGGQRPPRSSIAQPAGLQQAVVEPLALPSSLLSLQRLSVKTIALDDWCGLP